MTGKALWVALVTEVFPDDPEGTHLRSLLAKAREDRADLAVLPEIPLNAWSPVTKAARDDDAEEEGGARQERMAEAAATVGIALVGGAIVRDPNSGARHNTALLYDASGQLVASYRKVHLPEEEGYWETSHYEPGDDTPRVVEGPLPFSLGLQICSDVNRPSFAQLLAHQGAEIIVAPRATPPESYERWKLVLRANAVMSGAFVISVNRPRPEGGAHIGGPSIAIAPDGSVLAESTDPVCVVALERSTLDTARADYPGYLKRFPELYARGWEELA
jgi:N-carbamoylputrescine amidase